MSTIKMNLVYLSFTLLTVVFLGFSLSEEQAAKGEILDACNSKEVKEQCKESLKPDFEYDAVQSTRVTYKNKKQFKEIEVPLYMGERYRLVFSKEGLPQDLDIEIYNKKFESSKRKLLWASKNEQEGQKIYLYEPERGNKLFIDYIIPETTDTVKKGCVVFAIGFQIK